MVTKKKEKLKMRSVILKLNGKTCKAFRPVSFDRKTWQITRKQIWKDTLKLNTLSLSTRYPVVDARKKDVRTTERAKKNHVNIESLGLVYRLLKQENSIQMGSTWEVVLYMQLFRDFKNKQIFQGKSLLADKTVKDRPIKMNLKILNHKSEILNCFQL